MRRNIFIETNNKEIKILTPEDFSEAFNDSLSPSIKDKIRNLNIEYVELTLDERDACIRECVRVLLDPNVEISGAHRLEKWEKGWGENLKALKVGKEKALLPLYFKKDEIVRWRQKWIKPLNPGFDFSVLSIILEWLFEKYASQADSIYEFGCGTGHHLLRLREFNRTAKIYGLDWAEASQKIILEMIEKGIAQNTYGKKFDFFNPDESFSLDKKSVVYTVGALEQVGERHENFLKYLIKNKPKICFHIEPIAELLDPNNLLDFLSIEYFKKRNYLSNFLTRLRALESEGKIKIHDARRTYLGGNIYVDHYSVVVWSPL